MHKKFHRMGTAHKAQYDRLEKSFPNSLFLNLEHKSGPHLVLKSDAGGTYAFTSPSTHNQFITVLESFGVLEQIGSRRWSVQINVMNPNAVMKSLFSRDPATPQVEKYRETQIVCTLYRLRFVSPASLKENGWSTIRKKNSKGITRTALEKESSVFQEAISSNPGLKSRFLELVADHPEWSEYLR